MQLISDRDALFMLVQKSPEYEALLIPFPGEISKFPEIARAPLAFATFDPRTHSPKTANWRPASRRRFRNSRYSSVVPTIGKPRALNRT